MDLGEVGVCSYNKNALYKILKKLMKMRKPENTKERFIQQGDITVLNIDTCAEYKCTRFHKTHFARFKDTV